MYSRNCGSNWPRSCALIARNTRGSALIGPGPMRSRGRGFSSSTMRMVLHPVPRDVDAAGDPRLFSLHVLDESLERGQAPRAYDQPAVQPHRHHAPAFGVEHIERIFQVIEELRAGIESLRSREAHVVRIER